MFRLHYQSRCFSPRCNEFDKHRQIHAKKTHDPRFSYFIECSAALFSGILTEKACRNHPYQKINLNYFEYVSIITHRSFRWEDNSHLNVYKSKLYFIFTSFSISAFSSSENSDSYISSSNLFDTAFEIDFLIMPTSGT